MPARDGGRSLLSGCSRWAVVREWPRGNPRHSVLICGFWLTRCRRAREPTIPREWARLLEGEGWRNMVTIDTAGERTAAALPLVPGPDPPTRRCGAGSSSPCPCPRRGWRCSSGWWRRRPRVRFILHRFARRQGLASPPGRPSGRASARKASRSPWQGSPPHRSATIRPMRTHAMSKTVPLVLSQTDFSESKRPAPDQDTPKQQPDRALVQPQKRLSMRCDRLWGEATPLCASADGRRAPGPGGGPALARRLRPAPLPDRAGQRPRRAGPGHRAQPGLRRADRARRHHGVRRARAGRPDARQLPAPHDPCGVPRRPAEPLRALLHQSPRTFGKPTSLWTLDLAAEVSFEEGLTPERVSGETIRATLVRLGVRWKRAKHWITSPDPEYARKKVARDRLIRLARTHPDGSWASRTRSGGAAWPTRPSTPGPSPTSPCGWSNRRSRRTTPTPRRWPATACWCAGGPTGRTARRARKPGCGSSTAAPSAPSPPTSWTGAAASSPPPARRRSCWSGTTPPGTSARRCAPGSATTTGRGKTAAAASGSSPASCPSRAPGSTPSSPSGSTASARSSSPTACSPPANWPSASAPPRLPL